MIKKWKTISRKVLLDHPRMKIVEDEVKLPDGNIVHYIRESPSNRYSVGIIALDEKGRVLLQKEYSYPPDEVMYQLPGGAAYDGEEIIAAANRELAEEAGLVAAECSVIGSFFVNNRRSNVRQFIVVCKGLTERKLKHDAEEFIEHEWVSYQQITDMIKKGQVKNINMLAALHLYENIFIKQP